MSKLFKNSKQILAVVMAFAILAVSLFAGGIVASADSTEALCAGTRIEYWDGTSSSSFSKGNGTENNPFIIENAKQLNWVCTGSDTASEGKYYKVDPAIKAFILQPQAIVTELGGDDAFMNIATAAETQELFEVAAAGKNLKNWLANHYNKVFAGFFDGSGVAIYGLYADDALLGRQQCALFPITDGNGLNLPEKGMTETPTVIKNFALKNSFLRGLRRLGAIVSTSWYDAGGTKINGFVEVEDVEVANCFIVGQDLNLGTGALHGWNASNPIAEMGTVFGSMGNDAVITKKISVYGNKCEYRMYGAAGATTYTVADSFNFNRIAASNTYGNTNPVAGELHDSIILGTAVTGIQHNTQDVVYVSNVYSDVKTTTPGVTVIENGFGAEGQAAMTGMDWEKDWFMGHYGPTFRAFHGTFSLVQTETTHCYACDECGFKSYGGDVAHNWNSEFKCVDCEYECKHNTDVFFEQNYAGDCVTDPGSLWLCNVCGKRDHISSGPAPGHELEWVEEIYANCEEEGREGYWHCKTCGGNFTADSEEVAKWAAMDTTIVNPDVELITPIAPHNATDRDTGEIKVVQVGNDGHYWICVTCDGKLLAIEKDTYAEDGRFKKHKYEDGVCKDCGWECPEHDYQPSGYVLKVGSCTEEREEEYKCTNCGDKKTVVTEASHKIEKVDEVPATDKLEGTKAHYACSVCKEIYTDAEGKNKASSADLVIAKVLPKEYQNQVIGNGSANNSTNNNANVDNSTTSPSTSDNFASVVALAAIAGAALVLTRKVKR